MSATSGRGLSRYLRGALILIALLLPMASLMAFGGYWLWQNGYMIYWALAACAVTVSIYAAEIWLLRPAKRSAAAIAKDSTAKAAETEPAALDEGTDADPTWTPRETAAWEAVRGVARSVDPDSLDSRQAFVDLGRETVEAVARSLHPKDQNPVLNFTVPEALALIERVASRLRPVVVKNVPLGDQVTVGQAMRLYNWTSVIGIAEKAYDIWRVIRFMNPLTAATQEMREQITKRFYNWGREALARKLTERYVEEVGRAAIELYGGRLKVLPDEMAGRVTGASQRDLARAADGAVSEPLRILIGGQIGAGKSSLINAMSSEVRAAVDVLPATPAFTPYELQRDGVPAALLFDSPGLGSAEWGGVKDEVDRLADEARNCDLLIWVANATRADRELDRLALEAIRSGFAADSNRRPPPMLLVISHIDKLRPFTEWSPPYDLAGGEAGGKAASIKAAMTATGSELGFGDAEIIPVCLATGARQYNIDVLWANIHEVLPQAQSAQLVRRLGEATGGFSWGRLWSQAVNAGRVLKSGTTR